MSTKRRVGVSAATTEAARRALMQPVQCWEKVWVVPEVMAGNSSTATVRVKKWVKTTKPQQFSDDEGTVDEPLAPLPDEVEVVDGDDDEGDEKDDKDEAIPASNVPSAPPELEEVELPSKPPSPKPQLTMGDNMTTNDDALDESLKAMESNMDNGVGVGLDEADTGLIDISSLAPDGLSLEDAHDLSQIDPADALLGGPLQMDESGDPFAET
ncbi:hypothetical protein MIND_00533600 [Mycena indigotica]|uniref:Uncharacterized protein n=1 Tax=Mycena indigotica TaxID=2126181 RepID=A0A8H6W698_9AGAR|nr:uncharacterized protein MIND_00533600 [Mycena indigotica]KAF7307394.1 hypothetical protein MIND_00533600 [Mycena indigotica]